MSGFRIAVLGNSHAASLKNAWDETSQKIPGISALDIFARPNGQGGLSGLSEQDGNLVANEEELKAWFTKTAGTHCIEINKYDAFIVHAFGPDAEAIYTQVQALTGHHYSKNLLAQCTATFSQGRARQIEKSPQVKLAQRLRKLTQAPVFVSHKPMFAQQAMSGAHDDNMGTLFFNSFLDGMRIALQQAQCQVLAQPAETLVSGCYTRNDFAQADMKHMNGAYGVLLLKSAVDLLRAA